MPFDQIGHLDGQGGWSDDLNGVEAAPGTAQEGTSAASCTGLRPPERNPCGEAGNVSYVSLCLVPCPKTAGRKETAQL